MRKIVLLILLLLTFSLSYGQAIDCVGNAGDTVCQSGSFRIDERLRLKSLPNTHALGVLTTNAQGLVILDTLAEATGVSIEILTDTSDAIHSWVWSIVSNPTIDSYLYATRGRLQKVKDSIIVWAGSTFVSTETDPVFLTYPAAGIGAGDISNWNTAYNNRVTSVATGYGVSGGTITATGTISADTAAMATRSRVQKAVDSLNIQDGLRVKYTDTASMLLPYQRTVNATSGTVTSVATNTGTGITGGTITTSGTIAADTTVLDTRAWRDKLKDSLNAQDALRVKYTDTASMLSPYLSEQHASVTYVAIVADTTISAAYTLTSRDYNRTIHCTNGSNIALTIPSGLGTTFTCVVLAEGAGTVTPTTSSTTFYYQPTSTTKIKSQGGATIRSWATANSYLIIGSLE